MMKKIGIFNLIFLLASSLLLVKPALAANSWPDTCNGTEGGMTCPGGGACPCGSGEKCSVDGCVSTSTNSEVPFMFDLGKLLSSVYSIIFPVGIAIGIGFTILAGFKMMMSEGEPNKLADAKEDLYSAIVGTLFIGLALVLVRIIIKATLSIEI